jgi:hypothetical protein
LFDFCDFEGLKTTREGTHKQSILTYPFNVRDSAIHVVSVFIVPFPSEQATGSIVSLTRATATTPTLTTALRHRAWTDGGHLAVTPTINLRKLTCGHLGVTPAIPDDLLADPPAVTSV